MRFDHFEGFLTNSKGLIKGLALKLIKRPGIRIDSFLSFLQKPELAILPKNKVSIQIFAIHDGNGAYG